MNKYLIYDSSQTNPIQIEADLIRLNSCHGTPVIELIREDKIDNIIYTVVVGMTHHTSTVVKL